MQMTVNLTVKLVGVEKSSIYDNGLPVSFTIEWGEFRHLSGSIADYRFGLPNAANLLIWIINRCPATEPEDSGTIANYRLQADKFDGKSDGIPFAVSR